MVCVCVCSLRSIENQMKLLSIGSTRRSRSRGRGATSSERGTMRRPTCGTAVARPEASLTLSPHSCVVATSPQWCISSRSTCAWWSVIPASCSDVSSISDSASGSISGGPHRKTCNGVSHMNPECAGGASHLWRVTAVGSVLKAALALRFTSAVIRGSSIGLRFDEPGKLGTALLYEKRPHGANTAGAAPCWMLTRAPERRRVAPCAETRVRTETDAIAAACTPGTPRQPPN